MIISGFHAIEEKVRSFSKNSDSLKNLKPCIYFSKPGPRVKKIIDSAKKIGIPCKETDMATMDKMVATLNETARDHRGILLETVGEKSNGKNIVDLDEFLAKIADGKKDSNGDDIGNEKSLVVILDSVTDPHNVGAIMRSCDQFGVDLLILPERNSAKDGEVVSRASSGADSWVPTAIVSNLVRAVEKLKSSGYWVYGADAGGKDCSKTDLKGKVCIIMGNEGRGIGRLLEENCDGILSIPTCGKVDSLNVSVATGILLYEVHRQQIH